MNTFSLVKHRVGGMAGPTLALTTVLLTACAFSPVAPTGAQDVRSKLTELQNNPDMANNAAEELRVAEEAVIVAEEAVGRGDTELGEHRVYMADNLVEIAEAKARTRLAEADRTRIEEEQESSRLAAAQERENESVQTDLLASSVTDSDLQQEIEALNAEVTDRGLELADVLFAFGSSELSESGSQNLDRLVTFLNGHPELYVLLEGHTDNVGDAEFNQGLSQRRAESVQQYLTDHGIRESMLVVSGFGLERPVGNNRTVSGREQNRRVEVIIED
ncbi:MAG: OmpA family protein [Natronospirillum sp.]|uniref:OmpA family protein n=1 Tax=Natronospirillum sp. TaxID=2812955 RepID=UPI0025FCF481|nr:OmpA family protein [Natronospirillum sp.]MCH8550837.1 OmpA family protein [Natronospirillum sp.]